MTENEKLSKGEIRPEIRETISFAQKRIIESGAWGYPKEDSLDPREVFNGPILDLNDQSLTKQEIAYTMGWIAEKLGSEPEEAPEKARYQSPDGKTEVIIYNVPLGKDEDWFLSRWQNQGEKPSFIFWPEDVYEWQVEESGYIQNS